MPSQKPLVPAGETGEICIFGGGVSLGYIGGYEEKNKAFQTLPDGTVRYQSGDLGYTLPNGNIAFLHRKGHSDHDIWNACRNFRSGIQTLSM